MKKYIHCILAYRLSDLYYTCLQVGYGIIFSTKPQFYLTLVRILAHQGLYYYRPFHDTKQATVSLFPYKYPEISQAIWQVKFKNNKLVGRHMGMLVADVLIDMLQELQDTHYFNEPILCTVPSHPRTIRKRGYQVTNLIARSAMQHGLLSWVEYHPSLIKKTKHNQRQSHVTQRSMRLKNPRGAFLITAPWGVHNKNIILLDDVFTTGATLDEITRILHHAGAQKILRITIAH